MEIIDKLLALLFVADAPASASALALAAQVSEGQIEQAIEILTQRMEHAGPLQIVKVAGGYQICTKEAYSSLISDFLKPHRQKITRSLLEILAIVAYRQPITGPEIDVVRGVSSDHGIRSLVERRLVQEVGRKSTAGRPILYGTTKQFLHTFKLNDLKELPELKLEIEQESNLNSFAQNTRLLSQVQEGTVTE